MRTTTRGRLASLAILTVLGVGAGAVVPAQAAYSDCPSGYACLWTGNNYPGGPNGYFYTSLSNTEIGGLDNKTNSIVNNGNSSVAYFYDRADMSGASISLNNPAKGGQSRDPMLSNGTDATSTSWADKISSAKFV